MKLDLIAIEKLCPAGLTPLAELRALISVLVAVMKLGMSSPRDLRSYAHMLMQHRNILGERTRYNHSLKVKAWVKQCPERTAWVRAVIGEAAIGSWVARLRAAYMSPRMVGDEWEKKPDAKPRGKYGPRQRKPFALVRLSEVEKLLPFQPRWPRKVRPAFSSEVGNLRHAARLDNHLASLGDHRKSQSPRPQKPVRFFPSELGIKTREPETEQVTQKYAEDPAPMKPDGASQMEPGQHGTRLKPPSKEPP